MPIALVVLLVWFAVSAIVSPLVGLVLAAGGGVEPARAAPQGKRAAA